MKKKFTSNLLWVFAIVASMSAFVSCKDYQSDDMAEIRNEVAAQNAVLLSVLQNNVDALEAEISSKYNELADLIALLDANKADASDLEALAARVATLEDEIATLQDQVAALNSKAGQIDTNADDIQTLFGLVSDLDAKIYTASQLEQLINEVVAGKNYDQSIADLQESVKVLESDTSRIVALEALVLGLTDEMKEAKSTAAQALALAKADSIRIDSLGLDLTQVKSDIENLEAKDAALTARIDSLAKATADSVESLKVTVGELQDAVKALQDKDEELQKQIDELKKIADLINNNYATTLKKLITGIIIQGTENDVTGYAALPLDIQSNILAAYYGKAAKKVQFPDATGLYDASGVLTAADIAGVKQYKAGEGDTLINESPNNAGTLYLTVNPNTSDFSGIRPTLVNSQDKEGAVKLGELQASDKVLTWAITRADNNAFYEVAATLDKSKIDEAKADFNVESIKSAVKNTLNQKSLGSLANLASTVFGNINGAYERYGVKVEYTDDVLGDRGVYSEYDILATAIRPLSFSFYEGKSIRQLPTFNISSITEKLNFNVDSIVINLDGVNTTVSVPVALSMNIPIHATAQSKGDTIHVALHTGVLDDTDTEIVAEGDVIVPAQDVAVNTTVSIDTSFTTTADLNDFLSQLIGNIQGKINTSIQDMVASINGKISDVANKINNNYINRINSLITRVNSALANPNHYLQPTLLYEGADGALHPLNHATFKLAGGDAAPLLATSYSAEIVAPAMKRFVKVVSAPAGVDLNEINNTDLNLNKVVNGTVNVFGFAPTVAGQYEIVYSALDYAGQIRTIKYYVNVVE